MRRFENKIYIDAAKAAALIIAGMFLGRYTAGISMLVVVALGVYWALAGKIGPAICCFVFLPLCNVISPLLILRSGVFWKHALRIGPLAIGLALALGAARRSGTNRLPFGGILPFLLCAVVPSPMRKLKLKA